MWKQLRNLGRSRSLLLNAVFGMLLGLGCNGATKDGAAVPAVPAGGQSASGAAGQVTAGQIAAAGGGAGEMSAVSGTLPPAAQCDVTAQVCGQSVLCPAVQLCAAIPLVSEVDLDRSAWTGRCVPECQPSVNANGCVWQQESCPVGYRCMPCDKL
jgi:hypothetical protein